MFLLSAEFSSSGLVDVGEDDPTGVADTIPARLSKGEFVITAKATKQLMDSNGKQVLDDLMDQCHRDADNGFQTFVYTKWVDFKAMEFD